MKNIGGYGKAMGTQHHLASKLVRRATPEPGRSGVVPDLIIVVDALFQEHISQETERFAQAIGRVGEVLTEQFIQPCWSFSSNCQITDSATLTLRCSVACKLDTNCFPACFAPQTLISRWLGQL